MRHTIYWSITREFQRTTWKATKLFRYPNYLAETLPFKLLLRWNAKKSEKTRI